MTIGSQCTGSVASSITLVGIAPSENARISRLHVAEGLFRVPRREEDVVIRGENQFSFQRCNTALIMTHNYSRHTHDFVFLHERYSGLGEDPIPEAELAQVQNILVYDYTVPQRGV